MRIALRHTTRAVQTESKERFVQITLVEIASLLALVAIAAGSIPF